MKWLDVGWGRGGGPRVIRFDQGQEGAVRLSCGCKRMAAGGQEQERRIERREVR